MIAAGPITGGARRVRSALVAPFAVWFAHFLGCWAAAELWPRGAWANPLAWGFTLLALLALGVAARRLRREDAPGTEAAPARRIARGALALAVLAVLFTAWPSVVLRG